LRMTWTISTLNDVSRETIYPSVRRKIGLSDVFIQRAENDLAGGKMNPSSCEGCIFKSEGEMTDKSAEIKAYT